ncbi:hypothetical protein D8Y22_18405 [Salinadaptatus halalkaliphilus]|uniref:DUF1109 domain-containing protein n=1 Tax=Salinadaptatus halalkaliphilus TaxID=2419781 RepID=A0A4S3TIQ1_9EURY|nr:hypothetical protein [Salinadaptatus halalkaliphilus]THE63420.1 hypothetical protein D8Y22_18405 [Salinadaptatus halalkaliphilus]
MNIDLDGGKVLYALGILFALGAFLYFVRDVVFGLSITVTAALLFVLFVAFFVGGLTLERDVLDVVAFVLAAIAYAVFLGYIVSRYELGETHIFLVLALSAALFVALGYGVRDRQVAVTPRTAGLVVVALLGVSLVLVGADILGGGVSYDIELEDSVAASVPEDVPDDRERVRAEAHLGTVTATNEFVFTRPVAPPSVEACVVGSGAVYDAHVPVNYDPPGYERSDVIGGSAAHSYDLEAHFVLDGNQTGETTFAVERGDDCDVTRAEPTLIVDIDGDLEGSRPTPV